jgi:hypothetical protein
MRRRTPFLVTATYLAVLSFAAGARATPNFPPSIQSYLPTPNTPACQICHVGPQERGTVITPFGTNMRARGLVAYDVSSLDTALDRMRSDDVDSDGDGDTDIDALKAGRDPNVPYGADGGAVGTYATPVEPRYGCGARIAPESIDPCGGICAAVAGIGGLALLRRRRSPRVRIR